MPALQIGTVKPVLFLRKKVKTMTFKTDSVNIPLYGHGLECVGNIVHEPHVTGTFAADPVTGEDGNVYGVFTVQDSADKSYPSLWAGTYRINASRLRAYAPSVFAEL